jgi:hypothetical protein
MVSSKKRKVAPLAAGWSLQSAHCYSEATTLGPNSPKGDLINVGAKPFVKPLKPCLAHVFLAQSMIPVNARSPLIRLSVCNLDLMLQTSWSTPKSTPTRSGCSFWHCYSHINRVYRCPQRVTYPESDVSFAFKVSNAGILTRSSSVCHSPQRRNFRSTDSLRPHMVLDKGFVGSEVRSDDRAEKLNTG